MNRYTLYHAANRCTSGLILYGLPQYWKGGQHIRVLYRLALKHEENGSSLRIGLSRWHYSAYHRNKNQKRRKESPSLIVTGIASREEFPHDVYDNAEHADFQNTAKRHEGATNGLRRISPSIYYLDDNHINSEL